MKPTWNPESDQVNRDQVSAYDEMRLRCPVAHSESLGWSVFRHADVMRVLHEHQTFSNQVSQHLSVPNGMDPPEHTVYRKIIERYFTSDSVAAFEPTCQQIATKLLREAYGRGSDIEVMTELASHFAVRVQCAFLGWPTDLHDPLLRWASDQQHATGAGDRESLSRLAAELQLIVNDLISNRRLNNADTNNDVTSSLMNETISQRQLSNEEVSSILRNWTVGELATIAASIGILIHHLAQHPDHQSLLRRDPSMLPVAIDEILRVHNPLHGNRRKTTCPAQLGGVDIDAGERVYLNWIAANRDEIVFEDAGTVKFDRDPQHNLLYGSGIHVCPGAPLARMELRVMMESLLQQTASFTLDPTRTAEPAAYPDSGYTTVFTRFQWK
ncbi:cytochrome P450 [Neorhodopirellula pilleata]|uniref:Erythromycin C-12 hydroxylase n=1 Tax=Neorhodopirellula pilleata TaxID=2714738 RepID=A0A5C6AB08_9BACT|nr:cytochrome P450 [Neorhodopirellula pilleata]TWT97232.1 Erythromycin C-12 hydroxylase [Neorhodopirellula pilleata]